VWASTAKIDRILLQRGIKVSGEPKRAQIRAAQGERSKKTDSDCAKDATQLEPCRHKGSPLLEARSTAEDAQSNNKVAMTVSPPRTLTVGRNDVQS
jgi:hypothetical protein